MVPLQKLRGLGQELVHGRPRERKTLHATFGRQSEVFPRLFRTCSLAISVVQLQARSHQHKTASEERRRLIAH